MNLLPPINKAFSMLIQQECQFGSPPNKDDKLMANFSKSSPKYHFPDNNNKKSSYGCGRGTKIWSFCNKIGHTVNVCCKKPGLPPYLKKPNIHQTNTSAETSEDINHEETERLTLNIGHTLFTTSQHKFFLALLQQPSTSTSSQIQHFQSSINHSSRILRTPCQLYANDCWILDT